MSSRLTEKWTETAAEAFGATGAKGDAGEEFLVEVYKSRGWIVHWKRSSRSAQLQGVDIILEKNGLTCTIDVKNNLREDGVFFVETTPSGWLFNSKYINEFVVHVNPISRETVSYSRESMQNYIRNRYSNYKYKIISFNKGDDISFLKWQKF